jgi:DNA-binding response OmpR family regulator
VTNHTERARPELIAIVEDDPAVARVIEQVLRDFAFRTIWCRTATDLLDPLCGLAPDLCIIDLGLPDMDGIELMRRVRAQSSCGILILTGRAYLSDRVMGLELGADDYMLKPFEPRELVARVRSILRRHEAAPAAAAAAPRQVAEFAGWWFNTDNNMLCAPTGARTQLSTSEANLLKVFVNNPNRILQREQLLGTHDLSSTDRSIDVSIFTPAPQARTGIGQRRLHQDGVRGRYLFWPRRLGAGRRTCGVMRPQTASLP